MDFAKKINAKKIGIATCVGLLKESRILADILRRHGFEEYGVGCKAGTQKDVYQRQHLGLLRQKQSMLHDVRNWKYHLFLL